MKCHCGLDFQTDQEITDHVVNMHASNVWVCSAEGCGSSYCYASRCWKHYRKIHLNIMLRQCPYPTCTYSHEEKGYLQMHLYQVHGHKPTIFCDNEVEIGKCWKVFPTKTKLEQHKKICGHHLKPFECPEPGCKGAYRNKFWLDNHIKTEHPQAH